MLTVEAGLTVQGDGSTGHGAGTSTWGAGMLWLSGPQAGAYFLEVTGGHDFIFTGGSISSPETLGSVYVDGSSSTGDSWIFFRTSFSAIRANVFLGKAPGGAETNHGGASFSSTLNAPVNLYGSSTITVDNGGTLGISNSPTGSIGGITYDPNDGSNPTGHIDVLGNNCKVLVTAPNAQPMPLPSITQESGWLDVNGKATISVGKGQPANTPGLQLSGGIFELDPNSYLTSDLTASGSAIWWNPSPATGTATTVLNGAVNWSSGGYISVGDMGNNVGHFTNWVQLQCSSFTMTAGTLNIGVGTNSDGDKVLVQGAVWINPEDGDTASLALYAMAQPACQGVGNEQWFLKTTNNGMLTGQFISVAPYPGCEWSAGVWNLDPHWGLNGELDIYWT